MSSWGWRRSGQRYRRQSSTWGGSACLAPRGSPRGTQTQPDSQAPRLSTACTSSSSSSSFSFLNRACAAGFRAPWPSSGPGAAQRCLQSRLTSAARRERNMGQQRRAGGQGQASLAVPHRVPPSCPKGNTVPLGAAPSVPPLVPAHLELRCPASLCARSPGSPGDVTPTPKKKPRAGQAACPKAGIPTGKGVPGEGV